MASWSGTRQTKTPAVHRPLEIRITGRAVALIGLTVSIALAHMKPVAFLIPLALAWVIRNQINEEILGWSQEVDRAMDDFSIRPSVVEDGINKAKRYWPILGKKTRMALRQLEQNMLTYVPLVRLAGMPEDQTKFIDWLAERMGRWSN